MESGVRRKKETPGVTIWFTGLPCSGKSTVAEFLLNKFRTSGYNVELLDGDVVRTNLTKGLGFSKEDRDTNIRRIGFVAELLTRNGVIVMTAAISPYRAIRDEIRSKITNFLEVYVCCPLEVCIERDVKGMYKKALAGQMADFTGVSAPYEEPLDPELVLHTNEETLEESANKVWERLVKSGYLPEERLPEQAVYTAEEETVIHSRLEKLGYL